jgi:hypothetical protein
VARIIELLPSDWKVKVFVISSRLLSIPSIHALPEVEIFLISEPKYKWKIFLLRKVKYPLGKLARKESLRISKRIASNTSASEFVLVFSTTPVLEFVSRVFEADCSTDYRRRNLWASIELEGQILFQNFSGQNSQFPRPHRLALFERADSNYLSSEDIVMEVSDLFGFSKSLTRKNECDADVYIEKADTDSKNQIVNWGAPRLKTSESGIYIPRPKISFTLSPISIVGKINKFLSLNLIQVLNAVFKFGYAISKSLIRVLSIIRKMFS